MKKRKRSNQTVTSRMQYLIWQDCQKGIYRAVEVAEKHGVKLSYVYYISSEFKKSLPEAVLKIQKMVEEENSEENTAARIRELEDKLAYSQLEVEGLNYLIDYVEKELKIDIRKKDGSQQQNTSD